MALGAILVMSDITREIYSWVWVVIGFTIVVSASIREFFFSRLGHKGTTTLASIMINFRCSSVCMASDPSALVPDTFQF